MTPNKISPNVALQLLCSLTRYPEILFPEIHNYLTLYLEYWKESTTLHTITHTTISTTLHTTMSTTLFTTINE